MVSDITGKFLLWNSPGRIQMGHSETGCDVDAVVLIYQNTA